MFALLYFLFSFTGAIAAFYYGKNTKNFRWPEYLLLVGFPVIGVILLSLKFGITPMRVFVQGMVVLPILESLTGFVYHKVLGARLWIYERYPAPGKYTSYLTLPIWGSGAVLLWLIAHDL